MAQVVGRKLYALGYTDLVSVIPPGAELAPGTKINPNSLGKVPGMMYLAGWAGYSWQNSEGSFVAAEIDESGANVGLRARYFPGLDIDSDDDDLTVIIVNFLRETLGPAPCRMSTGARRLFVYRTDVPFKKRVLDITQKDGSTHAVEMLAEGQQYLIYGTHPSGSQYNFPDTQLPKDPKDLTLVTEEMVDTFFLGLAEFLQEHGATVSLTVKSTTAAPVVGDISAGARNDTLASVAGTLQRRGLPPSAIYAAVWETNLERCNPPLESGEVQIIVDSVARYAPSEDLAVVPASEDFDVVEGIEVMVPVMRESNPDQMAVWVVPEEEWLLPDLIPTGGSSLLVAKPKVGKSTFARGMSVAMARGADFLGRELRPMKIMYVMFPSEGTEREAQVEFIQRLKSREGLSKENHFFFDQLSMEADKAELIRFLAAKAERIRPEVIFIDTLQGLVQAKDLNDYSSVHAAFKPIRSVAEPIGAHLCYLHHAGKGVKIDLIDMSLGSTALAGSVTVLMGMKRDTTVDTTRLFAARGRGVEFPPHIVTMDPETHEPALGTTWDIWKTENMHERVLTALAGVGEPLTMEDVRSEVGAGANEVRASVGILVESGALMIVTKKGAARKYSLTLAGDEFEQQEVDSGQG